jgi:trans-aconitate 2-methyltransferase
MPTWSSEQYLKFAGERTRAAEDLAARVAVAAPARVMDLGCGPGNSTEVLAKRWPQAQLTGLDSSAAMLASARTARPQWDWVEGNIATWRAERPYPVVYSNAALQWVPDHGRLLPQLLEQVAPGGALAAQVPANFHAPAHRLMRDLAGSAAWRAHFRESVREWHVETPDFYYATRAPHAERVDLWTTEYFHVMANHRALVEWYRGTGLRPFLDALPDELARARFLAEYETALAGEYPAQPDGRVLFPFLRLFFVAYR